jgi:hypothetical protein
MLVGRDVGQATNIGAIADNLKSKDCPPSVKNYLLR